MNRVVQTRGIVHLFTGVAVAALSACGGDGGSDPAPTPAPVGTMISANQACATIQGKSVGGATVTAAVMVQATTSLPSHCKVNALIAPKLNMELRLPNEWNGKLLYGGGGGYNGSIPAANSTALMAGYANVSSDSGHQGGGLDASFALNDPYAASLFGSGSVPTVASAAKEMLQLVYSKAPERSYFEGCSNGGREGLMAAQRSPNLFDGIIARAPAYNWVGLFGHFNLTAKALAVPGAALSTTKVALLTKAVRAACDDKDNIIDGVVSNPAACTFNPSVLACPGGVDAGDTCLSTAQLAVVNAWSAPVSFSSGAYTNPGWPLSGNEDDPGAWTAWLTGPTGNGTGAARTLFQDTTVKNYLARDPNANSLTYVWDSNPAAIFGMAALNEASNPDLRPFIRSGGKLILWHGGNDPAISYKGTAEYHQRVGQVVGQNALNEFARFYVAPGVNHCAGGPGADITDLLTPLDAWVTKGIAPGQLTTAKLNNDGSTAFDRPLCTYPQYARYTGPANDTNAAKFAQNYTCTGS